MCDPSSYPAPCVRLYTYIATSVNGRGSMTTDGEPRRGRGPTDPARRERIADAAIAVVAERGIEGVTHRAVAAAADVPLGSTTYHFATLDDLLAEALRTAAEHNIARMREWERDLPPGADLAAALAGLVVQAL